MHRGDFVQIYQVILAAGERAPQVPEDTAAVPLEMKVKGFLDTEEAGIGDQVSIRTMTGRTLQGMLVAANPPYEITFGEIPPELLPVGQELRARLHERGPVS
ncbi:MAG: 2-amino-4-ketopentanoate thiolase [Synergistales bacterium]|nr:2-amino-4-ketopentanoate thiolase [Synergistales bacterium]